MNPVLLKSRRGSHGRGLLAQIEDSFKRPYTPLSSGAFSWTQDAYLWPEYVNLHPRNDLKYSDFGKDRDPFMPPRGSIIGDCINMKHLIWQNGMTYDHFRKYILKIDFTFERDLSELAELLNKLLAD